MGLQGFACNSDASGVSARTADAVLGDLGGGYYGVNYTTTVSGHYAAVIMYEGLHHSLHPEP